ncbi:MAG: ATP-binding protein [Cyanobacteria bacterium P01_H01_bin.74]
MLGYQKQHVVDTIFNTLPSGLLLYETPEDLLRINFKAKEILGLSDYKDHNEYKDYNRGSNDLPCYLKPIIELLEGPVNTIGRAELVIDLPSRQMPSTLGYNLKTLFPEEESHKRLRILTFSDITDLTQDQIIMDQIKEELNQSRRLASIGTMIAGIAHEMNNPLTGISMSNSLIKMNVERLQRLPVCNDELQINESLNKICIELKKISCANDSAARLVNDLLSYAKPSTLSLVPLPLIGVVQEIVAALQTNAVFYGCELVINGTTDEKILCDRIKLEQVFYNLIKNACDAMQGKGQVTITFGKTAVSSHADKQCISTYIKDEGPGIDKTVIKRIFDPFFTTKGDSGVGLGLSICYRIIEQHGGLLSVSSEKSNGTVFEISLPIYSE